jgi:hypothetical protein
LIAWRRIPRHASYRCSPKQAEGVAEEAPQLRDFLLRAAASTLITAIIFASAPAVAQSRPHPPRPVEHVGPTLEDLDSNRGTGAYPLFATVDLQTGSATARMLLSSEAVDALFDAHDMSH